MIEVTTFGETMGVLRADGALGITNDVSVSIAGSESNVAIGLARLGHRVRWVGGVGDDAVGRLVTRTLAAERIDVDSVIVDSDRPTAMLVSQLRPLGVSSVDYHRTGSAGHAVAPDQVAAAVTGKVLHVSGITPALGPTAAEAVRRSIRAARELGMIVSFDVNHRSRLWSGPAAHEVLAPMVQHVDLLIGGPEEIALVAPTGDDWRDQARALVDGGVGEVVVKLGADGAALVGPDRMISAPAYRVPLVDPIGAGDAFVAGFLSARLEGGTAEECLDRGNMLGAFAVSTPGDWEGLPRRSDLSLLATSPGEVIR